VKRILIIQTAFLGDVVLATPVVSELKRIFPEAGIDILVKKGNESLLFNNPYLQNVHVFDKSGGKFKEIFRLTRIFRNNSYDLVINLHRFGSSGLVTLLSGGRMKYGFRKNPFSFAFTKTFEHEIGKGTHEVTRNLNLIREFGAVELKRPELFPSKNDFERVASISTGKYICLAPASVWFTKQLPEHKWVELIRKQSTDLQIILIGGAGDQALCNRIIHSAERPNTQNLCGTLSLLESAALMSGAEMNYVNDSGPLHLASAMNAPVTAFFCSTVPEFGFGPLSDRSQIIQIDEKLDCRPCGLHGYKECPKGHFKCGSEIKI
jgi:lipopolysaccharide heptosyltransferase II